MKKKIISYLLISVLAISLAACGGKTEPPKGNDTVGDSTAVPEDKKDIELDVIHTAVKEAYGEDYIPSMPIDAAVLQEKYGIKSDWYTDMIAEEPMISVNVDTFIAVQAKEDNVKDVETALTQYRDTLISDTMQYPINLPKINASKILIIDNNVFFIMLGAVSDDMEQNEKEMLKAAEEQNEIAVKAIEKLWE